MDVTGAIYDKDFRQKLMADPKKHYKEFGDALLDEVEIVVKKNSKKKTYIIMPSNDLQHSLEQLQAAGPAEGSASSAFCAGTIGSACSTASTVGTLTSAATASTSAS